MRLICELEDWSCDTGSSAEPNVVGDEVLTRLEPNDRVKVELRKVVESGSRADTVCELKYCS